MKRIFVRPGAPGLIVRDPTTMEPLPADGKEVQETSYWTRRLLAGDVIPGKPQAQNKDKEKEK